MYVLTTIYSIYSQHGIFFFRCIFFKLLVHQFSFLSDCAKVGYLWHNSNSLPYHTIAKIRDENAISHTALLHIPAHEFNLRMKRDERDKRDEE